ncbi:MAG TPA: hypothetical protein DDW51_29105 [Cyanobacteria bacterium UBA11367]|nr:hypothetical protein [Cyanobacteria bacterium UBA11367]
MIEILKVGDMSFTPFTNKEDIKFLKEKGIRVIDNLDCDLFVASKTYALSRIRYRFGSKKKYLVWTSEPRKEPNFKNKIDGLFWIPEIHIMNAYTGDIYLNNYTFPFTDDFFKTYWETDELELLNEDNFPNFKHKKVAALMVYRNDQKKWSLKRQGRELDLCYLRTQIVLEGHKLNQVDVYGQDWPKGISIENSRGGDWQNSKAKIMPNYHFNLCIENTNSDYYCSEKIWDSIRYGCLPIYYGEGNKIYEYFPKNSFLDYCDFNSPEKLFKYIDAMDVQEFRERMNLCIGVFNQVREKVKLSNPDQNMLLKIVQKIESITI